MNIGVEKTKVGKRNDQESSIHQSDLSTKLKGNKEKNSLADTLNGIMEKEKEEDATPQAKGEDDNLASIEVDKFPSLVKLRQMGIKDYKPSINHKMLTMGGYHPKLRLVSPKVSTTWPDGKMPKSPQSGTPSQRNQARKKETLIGKKRTEKQFEDVKALTTRILSNRHSP